MEYEVSYRNIKYPRLEFKTGRLLLVLPKGQKPEEIIEKHKKWIEKKREFIEECLKLAKSKKIIERSDEEFKNLSLLSGQ